MANQGNGDSGRKLPPYVSFVTFKNFVGGLKASIVPPKIDTSLMGNQSGATQSQIMGALRFLNLVSSGDSTTDGLRSLVDAHGTDQWEHAMVENVLPAYLPIVGDVEIDNATWKDLQDTFRDRTGAEGSVLDKALRFYLKALDEAGISYSPHFKKTRGARKSTSSATTSRKKMGTRKNRQVDSDDDRPTKGMIEIPLHFKNRSTGKLLVPDDFAEGDVAVVEAALAMAKVYAQQEGGSNG